MSIVLSEVLKNYIISDHNTIVINGVKDLNLNQEICKEITSWKNYNKEKLQEILRKINWNLVNMYSLETKANMLCNLLSESLSKLVVKKTIKVKNNTKWYSEELHN